MADFVYQSEFDPDVNIKVVGVGGGGGNALNCMVTSGVKDIEYIAINTDAKALNNSKAATKIQIGSKLTKGRGAGNKPEVGAKSAEENRDEIEAALKGADIIFITAGMGGGTGTGAAPVIAREAQKAGMLTVGVVTIPFAMEREIRIDRALDGVYELSKYVDSLLVINNERLCKICAFKTLLEAFHMSDDTLLVAVKSIADIITTTMHWNLDFNDVSTVLKKGGIALISTGEGEGENRIADAIKNAIESPLLNDNDIFNARKATIAIYTSDKNEESITMPEIDEIHEFMNKFVDSGFDTKFGLAYVPGMGKKIKITILASGFGLGTRPYVSDRMGNANSGVVSINDDVDNRAKEEERIRRREKFYGNKVNKQKRPHFIYKFSDADLDNEDVIKMVSESNTQTRRYETLKRIQSQSDDYSEPETTENISAKEEPATGKIYFGN